MGGLGKRCYGPSVSCGDTASSRPFHVPIRNVSRQKNVTAQMKPLLPCVIEDSILFSGRLSYLSASPSPVANLRLCCISAVNLAPGTSKSPANTISSPPSASFHPACAYIRAAGKPRCRGEWSMRRPEPSVVRQPVRFHPAGTAGRLVFRN